MVDRHRIAAVIGQLDLRACHLRYACDDLAHPPFHQFPHIVVQGADGACQLGGLRDHVAGIAGVKFAYGNHSRFQRIDAARHDRLQRADQLRADQNGIDAFVRTRRVAALPLDIDETASPPAMIGPGRMAKQPTGMPGPLCMP